MVNLNDEQWLIEMAKSRRVDTAFKEQIKNESVYTCEKHFLVKIQKYVSTFRIIDLAVIPQLEQDTIVRSMEDFTGTH